MNYDEKIVERIISAFYNGKIEKDFVRNLLDKNILTLEEFAAISTEIKC